MKYFLLRFFIAAFVIFFFLFPNAHAQIQYQEKHLEVTKHNTSQMDEATVRQKMRADGLAEPVIDKLIAQRKLWIKQGGNYNWSSARNSNPVINAPCNGLGVESGWGAWMWQNGNNSGSNPPTWAGAPAPNPGAPFYAITTGPGIDPNTPSPGNPSIPVVAPGFGNNSIKIGDDCGVGSNCNQLTYALTVTQQDTAFVFTYAVVIEDAGHLPNEQPYCEIAIYDSNGHAIQCVPLIYTGGPNIPGFYPVKAGGCATFGTDQYKPWTLVGVNLSQYVNQTLNVVITNCDCIYGGHFCYSYWDFLCGTESLSAGCTGNQSTICGPVDPQIAYTYTWSLNGVPIPPPMGNQQCITITPQPGDTITVLVHQPSNCDFHLMYVPASVQPDFHFTDQCGTFNFTDSTTTSPANVTITGWSWSFPGGNPTTANTQNATVNYATAGTYTAVLTVTCSAGCSSSVSHTFTVTSLPVAAFASTTVCSGNATQFTDNSISPVGDPIVSWNWSFPSGNPATSTSQSPSVTYPVGNYAATLTVTTQGGCTATLTQNITVNAAPVSSLSGNNVCFNNLTSFTDLSTGNNTVTNWNWNFGDGNNSALQNPTHTYGNPGNYTVTLIVTNNFGCLDTNSINIIVNPLPLASFSSTTVCYGNNTCFNDLSSITSGNLTSWSWNFADVPSGPNNISNVQNPCHIFTSPPGNYIVTLTVTSDSGCQSTTNFPVAFNPPPVANFTNTNVCLNNASHFTDASTSTPSDPVSAWNWSFGDGGNATTQNPAHSYSAAGTYTVIEIVTTSKGCIDTITNPVIVYSNPIALFANPDSGCSPVCETMIDNSTSTSGNIATWEWSFPGGNPTFSTSQTPQICWNNPGTYGVQLIVTTNFGCKDTLMIPQYINVFQWPSADFSVTPPQNSVNTPTFDFGNLWSSDVTSWNWNFGDGSPLDSISTTPSHSYSLTATNNDYYSYNVCIDVKNQHGCWATICKTVELLPEFTFYIPNCVTANDDGTNDFFFGKGRGIKDYNIWLFDRWGNLIWDCHYEGKNTVWDNAGQDGMPSACKWDAKVQAGSSGNVVQEDVYVWKVRLTDIFDKVHTYIGRVTVVK